VDLGNQIGGTLVYWLTPSGHHRDTMQLIGSSCILVTWMDSTSWSCTTAVTDAGSHDSGISPQLCWLPMLCLRNHNLLVPESYGVPYLRHTVNRPPPLRPDLRLAKKIPTSQVDMEMFLERSGAEPSSCSAVAHSLKPIARHALQKRK
jgi:hypothetical protein